jgi:endonuclease YncB( thermonuclease family)
VLALAALAAHAALAAPNGRFTERGTVTYVVDGDTVDVRLADGQRERVRLLGIDAPERGACQSRQASARARVLALGRRVVLRGDASQDTRDRYGRLLAYVWLPGGKDLGYQLVAGGFAEVYVHDGAFGRLAAYRRAELGARSAPRGLWRRCGTKPPPTSGQPLVPPPAKDCHPSYSECLPIVADIDCADVRGLGMAPVRVTGSDPYRLDGDGDGWGCE